jgi:DNA polymerase-4
MRRILLADADAFYVAVARAVDPDGAGRAALLIVGGSRESRGVVCSASYEVRKFGVRSAMPIARALRLCPDAVCVPVPFKACAKKSAEIRSELLKLAPIVEGASIDEWYLDLTGTEGVYHHEPLAATAQRIRAAVLQATGLTLSIGGGTNKLIAKRRDRRARRRRGVPAYVHARRNPHGRTQVPGAIGVPRPRDGRGSPGTRSRPAAPLDERARSRVALEPRAWPG